MELNPKYSQGNEPEERDASNEGRVGCQMLGTSWCREGERIRAHRDHGEHLLGTQVLPCCLLSQTTGHPSRRPGMGALFRGSGPLVPRPLVTALRPFA